MRFRFFSTLVLIGTLVVAYSPSIFAGSGEGHGPKADKVKSGHAEAHDYALIDTEGLEKVIDNGEDVVILDARSAKYDDGQRIPGAKLLTAKASAEDVAAVVPGKDAKIIVYCSNIKCPASAYLAKHLKKLGYSNVTKYPDGIEGWSAAGLPTEKASN